MIVDPRAFKIEKLLERRQAVGTLGALGFLIEYESERQGLADMGSPNGASKVNQNHRRPPIVSVVVTAFNAASTLSATLDSLLRLLCVVVAV
jgi:hypothetical protein